MNTKTNRSKRRKRAMKPKEVEAYKAYSKVISVLAPFPNETKLRIVKSVAILLGLPQ